MKKLTRMKLINWHRFDNCTIDFGDSTLLSGENGAGKSTLLDAIQFVIICTAGYFNKAAHENGKRKLTGYIRCKTGKETRPYERTGEISAHVALEFYEESKDRYFIIGAVVDSASEGQETTVRYLMENTRISDDLFLYGNQVKSIAEFRGSNLEIRQWCKTQVEARKMVTARLGRIEDKFFRLIPKALAFKPIDDIKDFVYSYVLDEKEVNIEVLRENVRTYQDMERTLDNVKKRMTKLARIEDFYHQVQNLREKDQMYEYFLKHADLDLADERITRTRAAVKAEEYRLSQAKEQMDGYLQEREEKRELSTNLRVELKHNEEFVALEEEKKTLASLQEELKKRMQEEEKLKNSAVLAMKDCEKLLRTSEGEECIRKYRQQLQKMDSDVNIPELKALTDEVIHYKQKRYGQLQGQLIQLQGERKAAQEEHEKLGRKIGKLQRKKLIYPAGVELLLAAIREEFAGIGRETNPGVLCEMLEIQDEEWRNAVEGYLNTQRFYILVEPENFDIALGIYERLRREKKLFGVGLINTKGLENYETAPEGTLASVVTSRNPYARQYSNLILGKVQMCERYEELKNYPVSITKGCMRYQNRVASAIKPDIFRVPFIGKNAFKVQLVQAEEELEKLAGKIQEQEQKLQEMNQIQEALSTDADVDVKYRLDTVGSVKNLRDAMEKCQENIRNLKENSTLIQKQLQLEELEGVLKKLEDTIGSANQKIGGIAAKIQELKSKLELFLSDEMSERSHLTALGANAGKYLLSWDQEYGQQLAGKNLSQFQEDYLRRRKRNEQSMEKAKEQMVDAMILYKTEHDFGAAASIEGFPEFAAVYDRLKNSELLDYEEKVQSAREAAEMEFREQFLAKLQENMKQAQSEFKELNKALAGIDFSSERYEFLFMPSKKYRSYYEMIMDDFNVIQGESLFSGMFHEAHKDVIAELFDQLSVKGENSTQALEEFTDYRTYMDYDIKIIHNDGTYSYYSKVCEEKSGGETQTPFYVTVAASFVQLYSNNIGGEAAGLVLFDEAFNNMDDERIGGVLEFLRRLPLQLIIAAPPDKIQYIGPAMDEILLVMTDQKQSYVEEYRNGK